MTRKAELKKNYQMLLNWYKYRAEENTGSYKKLLDLLAKLNKE